MEAPEIKKKEMEAPNALASLTDDLVLEVLGHLPDRSLSCCKCVCRSWRVLIENPNNHKKLPQTLAGFFYDSDNCNRYFTSVIHGVELDHRSWEFLPFKFDNVALSDCYNGLVLCWCRGVDGYHYVVCNPMTKYVEIIPPSNSVVSHPIGKARLAFDPTTSSYFHVIEYVHVEAACQGVQIYSSQTQAWIYKESKWKENAFVQYYRQPTVLLNGCLHIVGHNGEYWIIFVVDMEGNRWRQINTPDGSYHSMHQAQDHLCVCTIDGLSGSKLSISIHEDYGTDNWLLKHTVTTKILFGDSSITFGWPDFNYRYIVITVHPEWSLIFFARQDGSIIAYNMDREKVHVIPIRVFGYGRRPVKMKFTSRPYYIPYVPLFFDPSSEQ